jgi:hypothetical protein
MRQSRGQLTEGDHLLVLQVGRGERPCAVDHHVDEGRRDRRAFADHLGELITVDRQELGGLLGNGVAGWADEAGVGEESRHGPYAPFHDLARAGAAIDRNADASRQDDGHDLRACALRRQDLADVQPLESPVRSEPRELLARRGVEGLERRQPIDEIRRRHPRVFPALEAM